MKSYPDELTNAKMMTFRLIESEKTIVPLMEKANSKQLNLHGQHSFQFEKDVVESIPILLDPCMDYTWYKQHREELSQIPTLPFNLYVRIIKNTTTIVIKKFNFLVCFIIYAK
ncbi:hypothetical protein AAA799E16_01548 [Marine Group I thaumarchaeote SCGC AAA799-E16]|uniref:Uncharacterized protein n=4 Tax=Marine Group I TaxID=905826 RepID=A0A081RL30_9ARCH|nr:hypothetical protein AAA799N04_01698 [Marine Group I thaumarchaeote SCGC AAA799-N04]KER05760.1 hypothetical protein AAA799E16_01548 [Marine Group I thaumarchaeote SCGC AAA799-E16]KFM15623.1 hypothetical protein AAA799D11_01142 [Marine Group I thaumarchaeote SCGC AAA799-D11]KFM15786.1 hypothetical protein SCCGRSA3_02581 [Marine Group I thaumarchaeote SCGC RSA3]